MTGYTVGATVAVAHGTGVWVGTVTGMAGTSLSVAYGAEFARPGDDRPTRELVDTSRHTVRVIA